MRNKYVVIPILIHIFVIVGLLVAVLVLGANYRDMILVGDNYYNIAKEFVNGESLLHKFRGPVLPLIYSVLFIFPHNMHPFIRLAISLLFSSGTIVLLYRITKTYISEKEFLFGSLVFILNPVYIHWTLRPYPEVYLAFFLGLLILNTINYYKKSNMKYLIYASIIFSISFFIKPVFLFVPVFLLLAALFIKSKRIAIASLLLLIFGILTYRAQDDFTAAKYEADTKSIDRKYEYVHKILLISDSFWVDYVLKTKQFFKPSIQEYEIEYKDGKSFEEYAYNWLREFYQENPKANFLFINMYFIYKEPLLFLQKLLMSPLFYFSMSARPFETFIKLAFSIFSVVLSIIGINAVLKRSEHKKEIILIISIVVGYASLHLIAHAMNRYSLPILPYFYVWGGIPLLALKNKFCNSSKQQTSSATQNE